MPVRPSRSQQEVGLPAIFEEVRGLRYFRQEPARLLRDYPAVGLCAGAVVGATSVPSGGFLLTDLAEHCFDADAYDGQDFEFMGERL